MQLLILVLLLCSSSCAEEHELEANKHDRKLNATEGDKLHLKYILPTFGEDCKYQLSYNNETFHVNGLSKSSSNYPHKKHVRSTINSENVFGFIVISFTLDSINFEESGKYLCMFICGDYYQTYFYEYDITVYKPPGPANCRWKHTFPDDWEYPFSVLACQADNGHPGAFINCYTSDNEDALAHAPINTENGNVLSSWFLLDRHAEIRCCSVSQVFKKTFETCVDFPPGSSSSPQTPQSTYYLPTRISHSVDSNSEASCQVDVTQTIPLHVNVTPTKEKEDLILISIILCLSLALNLCLFCSTFVIIIAYYKLMKNPQQ